MDKEKVLKSRTVVVTPAQVKAIVATDVELVPAPGAGKALIVDHVVATLDFNSAAYTWANSDHTLNVGEAAMDNDAEAQALIEAAARYTTVIRPPAGSTPVTENTAIKLQAGGTGEPATGDSNLILEVVYREVDVTGDND